MALPLRQRKQPAVVDLTWLSSDDNQVRYPVLPPTEPLIEPSQFIDLTHTQSEDDTDEYGFHSSDEDAFFQAEAAVLETASNNSLKRRSDDDLKSPRPPKFTKTQESLVMSIARAVLRKRFSINQFRLKQEVAIARILKGESAAVIFPTGWLFGSDKFLISC
jgi:hypothetical protein